MKQIISHARSRAEVLHEAHALEQIGSEWTIEHAAAFCTLSESAMHRSTCPRLHKTGIRGVAGRTMVRFLPKDVRAWNADRTLASA